MKKYLSLLVFCTIFCFKTNSQITLTNNIGEDVKFKNMFSCFETEWSAREFVLSDFGISDNQELILKSGRIAINYSYWGALYQYNIYEIDENFPSSFDESKLIGSSQIEILPGARGIIPTFINMEFDEPIIIPTKVKKILVEIKKTNSPLTTSFALGTIAGTDEDTGFSWYKGCVGIGNGTGYLPTTNFQGIAYNVPEANFFITVNGEAKTILPFEITNDNNCDNKINNLSLTNQSEIKSVAWNFDDPSSGANNTSTNIDVSHQYSNPGTYNVTAEVTHVDNTTYTIPKEIEIFESPNVNSSVSLKQCDNSDINGFSFFNLNEVKEKIITSPKDYTITFHEEKVDAENKGTTITNLTKYKNENVSIDKIWARVENDNGCFDVSEVNLFVSTTQIPATLLKSYYECDNGTNTTDGISTFNFSEVTNDIINIFPANQQLDITYYRNEEDALAELDKITDISNYQNASSPNQENIYIRVDSKIDNSCLGLGAHISLNVEKVPVANPVTITPECDNDRDGFYAFDTSAINNTIIGTQTNVTVTYFDENGTQLSSPLPNPFSTKSQKITAKITNDNSKDKDGKCADETIINFVVNTVPVANKIPSQVQCDEDFDGVIGFDTSVIQNTIVGTQTGLVVKYFDENNNALPSPLPNPFITSTQTIKVRLENPIYDVCFEETTIDFIVNQKPDFTLISDDIICMNSNPRLEIKIENPTGNYSYTWRDNNNNIVGNTATIDVFKGGIYKVIATSQEDCNSDEKSILIKESGASTITINDIEVKDDSENNFIKINTANLGLGDYEFRLLDKDSNIIFNYQDETLFDRLEGGVYILELNDKNGCGSVPFEIALISFPKFFTPNRDNINDYWQIKGIDKSFYKSGIITIFNRYGNKIANFTINDIGWNGTQNGKTLPTNDYWFRVVLVNQNNEVKTRTGNFSLLRK